MTNTKTERVSFDVDGIEVIGTLHLPPDYDADKTYSAAVVGGSLTSVKEMMAGDYSKKLAEKGILALAIDYRNYGESGGDARQYEDPALKADDLSGAVGYLACRPDVKANEVGLLGICTSGGNVLYAAAQDERVGAVATVAGWFAEPSVAPLLYGSDERVLELRDAGIAAREKFEKTGQNDLIPAYHDTDETASHMGPMEYYMDKTRGGGVPEWDNELSVMSWNTWLDFDAVSQAPKVTAPTLIIHSDDSALPDQARKVHGLLAGPKELHWAEGAHFDFYDEPKHVAESAKVVADFFKKNLAA